MPTAIVPRRQIPVGHPLILNQQARRRQDADRRPFDNLVAARGIAAGALLGGILWIFAGATLWLGYHFWGH